MIFIINIKNRANMELYFLGTGTSQGIPVIGCQDTVCTSTNFKDKRLRTSVWIYDNNFSIIIDCGPDFRQQMLQSKCQTIDALLFTHEHADHTAGLDDIRPFYFAQGKLPIFASKSVLRNLENRFDYIFTTHNKYPGAPSVQPNYIQNNEPFFIKNKTVLPIKAKHGKLPVFGFKIDNLAYFTDVKTIENCEIEKIKDIKVLVINALQHDNHHSHFNLKDALNFINLVQPQRAYLIHISHHLGLHDYVEKQLPENVFLAYDNLKITI